MTVICRKMPTVVCRFKYFLIPQNHGAIEYSDTGAKTDLHRPTEIMPRSCKKKKEMYFTRNWEVVPKSKLQEQANDSVRSWNKLKMWRFPLHSTQLCSCLSQHCFPQIGNNSSWEEKPVVLPPKEWQIYSEFIFNFIQFVTQPWRPWIDYSRSLESSKSSESHSVMSHSLWPHGLYSPWNSPGQNTGVGNLSLLQGIFPTQGLSPGLLHCRQILYQLSHKGSLRILEWVACPFSSGSCWPRNRTGVSCMTGGFSTSWAIREVQSPLKQLFRVWIHENLIEKWTLV